MYVCVCVRARVCVGGVCVSVVFGRCKIRAYILYHNAEQRLRVMPSFINDVTGHSLLSSQK